MYTAAVKSEIEHVTTVFKDYIKASPYLDLVWSEKLGYLLLDIDIVRNEISSEPDVLESGENACELLLHEIALDVLLLTKTENPLSNVNALEKAEILRRIAPFISQLPEYEYLVEQIFTEE